MNKIYVVKYVGDFGFIKPWTAVRDGETFSLQFLTPSVVEGIEKKLFPELLSRNGEITKIARHKLTYKAVNAQQEQVVTRGWELVEGKKCFRRGVSVLTRGVIIYPVLLLAFFLKDDAKRASLQHICLCRNEDILLPNQTIEEITDNDFTLLDGYELRFGKVDKSFMVGYNRYTGEPMYGSLEIGGQSI